MTLEPGTAVVRTAADQVVHLARELSAVRLERDAALRGAPHLRQQLEEARAVSAELEARLATALRFALSPAADLDEGVAFDLRVTDAVPFPIEGRPDADVVAVTGTDGHGRELRLTVDRSILHTVLPPGSLSLDDRAPVERRVDAVREVLGETLRPGSPWDVDGAGAPGPEGRP